MNLEELTLDELRDLQDLYQSKAKRSLNSIASEAQKVHQERLDRIRAEIRKRESSH